MTDHSTPRPPLRALPLSIAAGVVPLLAATTELAAAAAVAAAFVLVSLAAHAVGRQQRSVPLSFIIVVTVAAVVIGVLFQLLQLLNFALAQRIESVFLLLAVNPAVLALSLSRDAPGSSVDAAKHALPLALLVLAVAGLLALLDRVAAAATQPATLLIIGGLALAAWQTLQIRTTVDRAA